VGSVRFFTMAGFLMVGLFECGIYFWTGDKLMSEVSFSGMHSQNESIRMHMKHEPCLLRQP
jgi:hypothetical protein